MAAQTISIESIEGLIRGGWKNSTFPGWLEARFEDDTRDSRAELLRVMTLKTILIYNFFLAGDYLLARDTLRLALAIHFLILTPWMIFVYALLQRRPRKAIRELAAASIPVAIALQVSIIYFFTESVYSSQYLYFLVMLSMYANTSQRLAHHYAIGVSLFICALLPLSIAAVHVIGAPAAHHMATPIAFTQGMLLLSCAWMTLNSNFQREGDFRLAYLQSVLDGLRVEEKNAEANHDALTGLANRRFLDTRGAEIWKGGEAARSPVSVIMMDIDHFKGFNDFYGHPAGDTCLKQIGACTVAELRSSDDLAVRCGGEEFLVLLPNTGIADAIPVAERIRQAIAALRIPNESAGRSTAVTASFGVASATVSDISLEDLISSADTALYEAKRNGRNQTWPPLNYGGISMPV